MKNRMAQTASPARYPIRLVALVVFATLLSPSCVTKSPDEPTGVEGDVATNTAGPDVVDLWGGGAFAAAINPAGQIVGVTGFQVVMWDHGTLTQVATLCKSAGCQFDSGNTELLDINVAGQVVGTRFNQAFVWDRGTLTNLGASVADWSYASSINNAGDVLGAVRVCAGNPPPFITAWAVNCSSRAVLWRSGSPIDLGTLGGEYSGPGGLNSAGEVVGAAEVAHAKFEENAVHAFLWRDGTMTDLGTLGGKFSSASGINSMGQIVGSAETADGSSHAVVWNQGSVTDLGEGSACAINAAGQIVGLSGGRAVVWDHGTMIDIGVPMRACGSFGDLPLTINAAGQVVLNFCADVCSAYLWDRGALTKLGGLSGDQATVFGINPRGWMVGQITGSGEANAVLWTP